MGEMQFLGYTYINVQKIKCYPNMIMHTIDVDMSKIFSSVVKVSDSTM